MYLCPNCRSAFSSDEEYPNYKCRECGERLIEMGVTPAKWRSMSEEEKEKQKNDTIAKNAKGSKTKSYGFHKFVLFIRVPLTILVYIWGMLSGEYNSVMTAVACVYIALYITYMIGSFMKKKIGLYAIIIIESLNVLSVIISLSSGFDSTQMFFLVMSIFIIYYYYVNKSIFFDEKNYLGLEKEESSYNADTNDEYSNKESSYYHKSDVSHMNTETRSTGFSENNQKKSDKSVITKETRYCRMCGAKLNSDALFCHNCGTKV